MAERSGRIWRAAAALLTVAALSAVPGALPPATAATVPAAPMVGRDGPQIPSPDPPADDAGDQARRILDDEEYRGPGTGRSLGERIRDWIRRQLPDSSGVRGPRLDWLAWPVIALVLAAAAAAAAFALLRLRSGRRVRADADGEAGTVEVTPLRSADEWAAEAERCEASGEWRQAIRARFRSVTGALIDRRVVTDVPGRTAGEHRDELSAAAPAAAPAFSSMVERFERVWYGRAPAGPEDAHEARELATAVMASVGDGDRR